ncbi:hypothetical protein [Aeromonas bestiarum]|uniref:hypothetical protein n=1 Tax=Aeromonas bestiarum TaxID=105751 RepID=UPI0032B27963
MSHNLCARPKEQQERVEVEKAAAYAVWTERNGHLASAESEANQHQGELGCVPKVVEKWPPHFIEPNSSKNTAFIYFKTT